MKFVFGRGARGDQHGLVVEEEVELISDLKYKGAASVFMHLNGAGSIGIARGRDGQVITPGIQIYEFKPTPAVSPGGEAPIEEFDGRSDDRFLVVMRDDPPQDLAGTVG